MREWGAVSIGLSQMLAAAFGQNDFELRAKQSTYPPDGYFVPQILDQDKNNFIDLACHVCHIAKMTFSRNYDDRPAPLGTRLEIWATWALAAFCVTLFWFLVYKMLA